jgi:hypothetical protein
MNFLCNFIQSISNYKLNENNITYLEDFESLTYHLQHQDLIIVFIFLKPAQMN